MDTLQNAIRTILTHPSPQSLVAVQGVLLARQEHRTAASALELTGYFFEYLTELQSKLTARQYSELASRLDISAVGMVALDNLLFASKEHFWGSFLLGAAGEGLMVAASRQYIKGWEAELGTVHRRAAWHLTQALWHASCQMQPDLDAEERWQAIQNLLAPVYDEHTPALSRSLLLSRVYQMLLAAYLSQMIHLEERA